MAVLVWFYITFIENNGMAFGMQLGSKIVLSLFRVIAISALGYYIWLEVKRKAKTGYLVCLSLVLAGAAGNLIDCMFYGLVFNESSPYYLSYFVPFGTGYAPFLMGKPADRDGMAHVDAFRGGRAFCVLQSGIQLCRFLHQRECRLAAAVLPAGDQQDVIQ